MHIVARMTQKGVLTRTLYICIVLPYPGACIEYNQDRGGLTYLYVVKTEIYRYKELIRNRFSSDRNIDTQ